MPGTPLPAKLAGPPLNDREAVADVCYRIFASIDHAEKELLLSSVTPDVYTNVNGKICNNLDELINIIWNNVSYKVDTIHYLTNMRISIDSSTTARVTFTAMAVHCRLNKGFEPGPNRYTTGAIWNCDVARQHEDDDWRMKKMQSTHVWRDGDASIMAPPPPPTS